MSEQLSFLGENGNIKPCPFRESCRTFKIGCQGQTYWCNNAEYMVKDAEND